MSDTNNIGDILQRVEQMLDALQASTQSSADFKAGCDSLQAYLDDQAGVLQRLALFRTRIKRV